MALSLVRCAALVSLLAAEASAQFPRAVGGKGYLAVPVGTHEKTKEEKNKVKRDDDFLETVLANMDFWYSTERKSQLLFLGRLVRGLCYENKKRLLTRRLSL